MPKRTLMPLQRTGGEQRTGHTAVNRFNHSKNLQPHPIHPQPPVQVTTQTKGRRHSCLRHHPPQDPRRPIFRKTTTRLPAPKGSKIRRRRIDHSWSTQRHRSSPPTPLPPIVEARHATNQGTQTFLSAETPAPRIHIRPIPVNLPRPTHTKGRRHSCLRRPPQDPLPHNPRESTSRHPAKVAPPVVRSSLPGAIRDAPTVPRRRSAVGGRFGNADSCARPSERANRHHAPNQSGFSPKPN